MSWIVAAEYFSMFLLLIILGYSYYDRTVTTLTRVSFRLALFVSLFAIACNIIGIYAIEHADVVPLPLNIALNTTYFWMTVTMVFCISFACLAILYEDRHRTKSFAVAARVMFVIYALHLPLYIVNLSTGWLFSFDASLNYVRGPLNAVVPMALGVNVVLVMVCYALERKRVNAAFRRILLTLPIISIVLAIFQLSLPNIMLSGSAAAFSLLILFIYSQQQRVNTDHLTELVNRETFYRSLERLSERRRTFHVLAIALRNYKSVNNRFGQRIGDRLLRVVGAYLQSLSHSAIPCRYAGVSFVVILPDNADIGYETLLASVRERFAAPWEYDHHSVTLHAVFADIHYPEHARDTNELIDSLEYAIRIAKSADNGAFIHFDQQMRHELGRRNYVISLLEPALANDRFFLHFQPVVDTQSGRVVGAEALLRLADETGASVSPAEFIPLAEESGVIGLISWMVLEKVCAFLAEHPHNGPEWISVNMSASQYGQDEIVPRLLDTLARYQVPSARIKLELTESVIIEDRGKTRAALDLLQAHGVGVCLDDFGTGYSNLVSVVDLPLDLVKLDKSLVAPIYEDPAAYLMLKTVVKGLRALGRTVLAEGVETREQYELVRTLDIARIQGFYFAHPMDGGAFIRYLNRQ